MITIQVKQLKPIIEQEFIISTLALSDDENKLSYSSGSLIFLHHFDLNYIHEFRTQDICLTLNFSHDNRYLAAGSQDTLIYIIDVLTNILAIHIAGNFSNINRLRFLGDNLLVCNSDGEIQIWNVGQWSLKHKYFNGGFSLRGLAICQSLCQLFATIGDDSKLIVYNIQQLRVQQSWLAHKQYGEGNSGGAGLCFSSDGGILISGGFSDFMVKLWNVKTQRIVRQFVGHTDFVWSIGLYKQILVSVSPDSTIKIRRIDDGTLLLDEEVDGKQTNFADICISQKLGIIYTGGNNGKLKRYQFQFI